jgi:histidyl-tRNA synthetase
VRGLDYYVRTVYEFDHPLLGAQSGIGGGGRYDGLSETIGGPPLPGIGFGLGLDRTVLAMEAERVPAVSAARIQGYGVPLGGEAERRIFGLVNELRINWVWMPPWGPDKITDDGREQLRALGFNV